MPLLFLKTGWMMRYQGPAGDKIDSSMSYVKEHGSGHERLNFKAQRGKCFGYAPVGSIDIVRHFGASEDADYVDGVDVIWAATRPKPLGGLVIVGWYRNARVFRYQRPLPSLIIAEAQAADCTLLDADARLYELPSSGPGAFRTTTKWYGNGFPKILRDVRKMVDGTYTAPGKLYSGKTEDPDITRRAEIERIAVNAVSERYIAFGYDVVSVEKENKGWDLEATKARHTLQLEVKGTSHTRISPLLTPNEYTASKSYRRTFHLCIVTNVLSKPSVTDLRYILSSNAWLDQDGNEIWEIFEVTSGQAKRRQ